MTQNGHGAADAHGSGSAGGTEQAAPGERGQAPDEVAAVPGGAGTGGEQPARPSPSPRPAPGPRDDAEDDSESPTVRTPSGRAGSAPSAGPPSGRPGNDQVPNGHAPAGQAPAGQAPNGQASNGHLANGQAPNGQLATGQVPNGRVPNGAPNGPAGSGEANGHPSGGEAATVAVPAGRASWPPADAEATQVLPRTPSRPVVEQATERIPVAARPPVDPPTRVGGMNDFDGPGGPGGPGGRRGRGRRRLLVLSAVVVGLGLLYVGDLLLSSGSVPRGVTVAGVGVGGMSLADAEERLRAEIGPRTEAPIPVTVGDVRGEIEPVAAGLSVDWAGTLEQAGSQPLNPITRITSFFSEREVGVVTSADPTALSQALEQLGPVVDREPVEGSVRFEGTQPQPVDPQPGQRLDVPASAEVLQREWANGNAVALPLTELPATTTAEDVTTAIEQVARPAVAAPVTVIGENDVRGELTPEVIAASLSFVAANGDLVPELNQQAVQDALAPQMAASEVPGRDATFEFSGGRPVVVPSQDGRGVDYEATLAQLLDVLAGPPPREITAVYADQPAEVTTEELQALGNPEVIGEFTTGGFAADSGVNIRRAAQLINGTVVQPGETFSLDDATGPRTAANGYVEAGVIQDGRSSRGIAGGASQVSTTLYNAAYFAGMTLVEHQAHSYYISRYPAGREATIATGAIDNRFRNDNPTPVLIRTVWTPTALTVQIFGQRQFEVTGSFGPRTKPTEPNELTLPAGEDCHPSNGSPGFTITDTRTLRNVSTGETRTETITTRYNPAPRIVCEE
ncbi:VanW family protein [Pseudonocardia sichuanensis]